MSAKSVRRDRNRGAAVRAAAARRVARVAQHGQSLAAFRDEPAGVDAKDLPLLGALVAGALRWHHRLDWQAGELLTRPLPDKEAELAALIRLGLFQLQWLRTPEHAAVSATVEAASHLGRRHAKSLVNAVLRRFLREREELEARMSAVPVATLSHPAWLIGAIVDDWPAAAPRIFAANNALPPMWLRVNARLSSAADYVKLLETAGIGASLASDLPEAVLLSEPIAARELPGFADGLVSVQDGAAQYAAPLLSVEPGQRVLDACAAPGGKLAHILETSPGSVEAWGVDIEAARLQMVAENLARLGLQARLVEADVTDPESWWDGELFDRILIDAPCTATGVIRRHPDIKLLRHADDVAGAVAGQERMLETLWPLLKPGGRLVYATCSVLKIENGDQIDAFRDRHKGESLSVFAHPFAAQTLPGEANRDGFYYACIDRGDER